MKRVSLWSFIFFTCMILTLSAQTVSPKWRFGVGAGLTSFWLQKKNRDIGMDLGIIAFYEKVRAEQVGNRFGWHIYSTVSFHAAKPLFFAIDPGFSKNQLSAYRKVESGEYSFIFGGHSSTVWDTIRHDAFLLDIPLSIRLQSKIANDRNIPLKFFLEAGFVAAIPLINNSSIARRDSDGSYSHSSFKEVYGFHSFFGFGYMGNKNLSISLRFTSISREHDKDPDFELLLIRLMVSRYF